jgi:hypothetical protein
MTDTPPDEGADQVGAEVDELVTAPVTSQYKLLGLLDDPDGVGVLGQNDADTGTPIGAQGAVPKSDDGYGLATPDDARVKGVLDTGGTDFVVEADDDGTDKARNVVMGHSSNTATTGTATAFGATIRGGGDSSGPNEAVGNYSTVGGGKGNAGTARGATVAGGIDNEAGDRQATVLGGASNVATAVQSTVIGGTHNAAEAAHATVGGGDGNLARGGTGYATVAGGQSNVATVDYATVGGGAKHQARSDSKYATIGGGIDGDTLDPYATIGGGSRHFAEGTHSTITGGRSNSTRNLSGAGGKYATIPGGIDNTARENYSFAAGNDAEAIHEGAFVLGDPTSTATSSMGPDEVRTQMPVYAPSFNTTSARARKTAVEPVDPGAVLSGVESLSVSTWEFERDDDDRHIGPMAGEFNEAFAVGVDDGHINTIDADGVALAAIQGLAGRLAGTDDRLDGLESDVDGLDDTIERVGRPAETVERVDERLDRLESDRDREDHRLDDLEREADRLCDRMAALEARVAALASEAGQSRTGDE